MEGYKKEGLFLYNMLFYKYNNQDEKSDSQKHKILKFLYQDGMIWRVGGSTVGANLEFLHADVAEVLGAQGGWVRMVFYNNEKSTQSRGWPGMRA